MSKMLPGGYLHRGSHAGGVIRIMAYGNWGGKVWCDGVLMGTRHYDNTIPGFEKSEEGSYGNAFGRKDVDKGPYHATVGDESSDIVVMLYKCNVVRIMEWKDDGHLVDIPNIASEVDGKIHDAVFSYQQASLDVTIGDIKAKFEHGDSYQGSDNKIDVEFTDKKGRKWHGASGYLFGYGHEEMKI